ncbi:6-phosphofructokinase [Candidatus Poribacteria bacterium]|nr:MAG: 6-phosphofructokinase [Candidatus Poribacteria bacterium]
MLQQIKPTLKVRGNLVVGQSGNPSAVFNTCLYGIIQEAKQHPEIQNIYGMADGVEGLLKGDLIDLGRQNPTILENLKNAPSAVLSSNHDTLVDEDYDRALEICKQYKIRFVIYMGDKGAMSTADRLAKFAETEGYPLYCIGVPHSVENTLGFTDHCFGYGTAARANAIVARNVGRDVEAMGVTAGVKIIEIPGGNSGWLAAATALAKDADDSSPHLIYLPESGLDPAQFLADVEAVYRRLGYCLIVVSEGIQGKDKCTLPSDGCIGEYLCALLAERLQLKASWDKLEDLSRFGMQSASVVDSGEALMAGQAAVRRAVDGMNGFMITIARHLDPNKPYSSLIGMVRLRLGAKSEKVVPEVFINEAGNFVTEAFEKYVTPLIGGRLPATLEPDPNGEEVRLEPISVSPPNDESEKDIFLS